ncbi:hypothetical protein P7C73_g4192, partial [Tremellales sp. Uapishka_1]
MPVPPTDFAPLVELGKAHVPAGLGRIREHILVKGEGAKVWDEEGKEFLDFTTGIGVVNLGHCHPAVTSAVVAQAQQITHVQCSISFSLPYLQLVKSLIPIMPHPSLDTFFLWNSGSEAVEFAIKLVRTASKRQNIITMIGGYHGRTFGASGITRSKPIYTQHSGTTMQGVYAVPFPYWHALGVPPSTSEEDLVKQAIYQLEFLFKTQTAADDVAAIFIEPLIGEGGYVPAPPAYLRALRSICDKHGIMLVLDEVQTGFGRTGTMFNCEQTEGLKPDVMIFAKGIANGFPLSGVVSRKEIMDKMEPGSIGGTYAGNAVSCAAGVAVAEVFRTTPVLENVNARSKQLLSALRALQTSPKTSHLIADVRGKGLMVAIEFRDDADALTMEGVAAGTKVPKKIGKRVQEYCLEKGVMILTTSCFDTIRFIPPLIVSEEEMAHAMSVFREAVEFIARDGDIEPAPIGGTD